MGGNVRVKNECWYILAADPGGVIYHGLEPGVNADTFYNAMLTGRIDGVVRQIPVRPGDCYYIPSGTPHALGAGVLVAEVQTPSDITYRTYDWGRLDPNTGRPRELHLDQAMDCIDFDSPQPPPMQERSHVAGIAATVTQLVSCPSFVIEKIRMAQGATQHIACGQPAVWIMLQGEGLIEWQSSTKPTTICSGNVVLLPAALPDDATLEITQPAEWLNVTVPLRSDPIPYPRR